MIAHFSPARLRDRLRKPLIIAAVILVEAVCCSLDEALLAEDAGADRLELCGALEVGGLTPSIGLVAAVRARTSLPLMGMVRPRPGDFTYDEADWTVLAEDAGRILEAGADGLVLGALRDGRPDRRLGALAALRPQSATFHRAIDACPDPVSAAREARELGFARVLTSGGRATALEGAATIRRMAAEIEVLVCGGVRASNVRAVLEATSAVAVHAGPRTPPEEQFLEGVASFGARTRLDAAALRSLVAAVRE